MYTKAQAGRILYLQKEYSKKVQEYVEKYPTKIYKAFRFLKGTDQLHCKYIYKVVGDDFPKAEWVEENDIQGQIVALLGAMGFIFYVDNEGNLYFSEAKEYEQIVENHLKLTGRQILDKFDWYFTTFGGSKITYKMMEILLGEHFPKAPYVDKSNTKACIILFMYHLGIIFKFDDEYLYFA